jgi:Tfp pilus assembly protein PilV
MIVPTARSPSGFSLFEILLSLMILGGATVGLFGAMNVAEALDRQARFESEGAAFAERELEMLKIDLLAGTRSAGPRGARGRFRHPGGWKVRLSWTAADPEGVIRTACTITQGDRGYRLESFLFFPRESVVPNQRKRSKS